MRSPFLFAFLSAGLALAPAVGARPPGGGGGGGGSVPPNSVVVVTSDGFFVPDTASSTPLLFIPDSSFPGAPDFVRPAVQWEPRTDCFLVASADRLFRVCITSLEQGTFTIDDVTPSTAAPMKLLDLDVNPGTGALYLLDQTTKTVERYQAPYAAGMVSDLSIPIPPTTRSIALDSRAVKPALLAGETMQVTRVFFDGSTQDVSFLLFPTGLDQDPQIKGNGGSFMCSSQNDVGVATGTPSVMFSMNYGAGCLPLAFGTEDVEWDPIKRRAYVLAEDGTCPTFSSGPNQVVRFPTAQVPGIIVPKLHTYAPGSGVTGTEGDLAVVYDDFAFVTRYGESCYQGSAAAAELDALQLPVAGFPLLTLELRKSEPLSPALLVIGLQRSALPLLGGCLVVASPDFLFSMGTTDAQGFASLDLAVPPTVPAGTDLYLQGAAAAAGGWSVSHGLLVHVGIK